MFVVLSLLGASLANLSTAAPAQAAADNFYWPASGHTDANDVAWHRAHENGARAVDIQAPLGTDVGAAQSGIIATVNKNCADSGSWGCGGGFGNYVIIRHDRPGVPNPL